MMRGASTQLVRDIMFDFARATGLEPESDHPRRYLWTDAFAVCDFLELYRQSGDETHLDLALRLVDQVHHVLGKHRPDDVRRGWISGLNEEEGERHPASGGLRIGKRLNERKAKEPSDERLEWDQDGQYYHYLTKWMHALHQVSRVTGEERYLVWAMEMAKVVQARFSHNILPGGPRRIYWKMSIDLSYPLVRSMGQHDPLDGYLTYRELQATANKSRSSGLPDLTEEIKDMRGICQGGSWVTDDPLGVGGLLTDAHRAAQLIMAGEDGLETLLGRIVESALPGTQYLAEGDLLGYPVEYRLAFRELGFSIGLKAAERLDQMVRDERLPSMDPSTRRNIEVLANFAPAGRRIDELWSEKKNWKASSWTEHRDINMAMLATSLAPESYLRI